MEFEPAVDLALLLLRIGLGATLAAHGYAKFFAGGKIDGTAAWFDSMGMRPGKLHAYLAASGEIAAGICFATGFFTSFAALGFVALMTVAWFTVHRSSGFFILNQGWEYVFVLALTASAVATIGPGQYSIDAQTGLDKALDGWPGLAVAVGGGVLSATALLVGFFRPPVEE